MATPLYNWVFAIIVLVAGIINPASDALPAGILLSGIAVFATYMCWEIYKRRARGIKLLKVWLVLAFVSFSFIQIYRVLYLVEPIQDPFGRTEAGIIVRIILAGVIYFSVWDYYEIRRHWFVN